MSTKKRTDTSFRLQQDEEHHLGISPLTRLNVGLVSTFPLIICTLAVWEFAKAAEFLDRWEFKNKLTKSFVSLKPYIPLEFNRKPRSLDELQRWKATEFRSFAISWANRHISKYGFEYPNKLLCAFVTHCEKLYGKQFLIYNVHILCHLVDD
ncbi:hypothetical protein NQ318_004984, partial [Aromia moschata]